MKVALATLGCKVNQFESAAFLSELGERDVELVPFSHKADVYIVNTCAVTAKGGAQSRQVIRRALKVNPKARLVVTGCYSQVAPQDVLEIANSPICIVGNGYKHRLVDIALSDLHCDLEMHMGDIARLKEVCPLTAKSFGERTRAYMKVQDGCNSFCSYCIVPYARGRSRSYAIDQVLNQAALFAEQDYREVVLTGIHLGHYGLDLEPKTNLVALVRALVAQNLPIRYRLSSLEPTEITDELLELMAASAAIMPYLHIPLQSGDDGILKKMNRRYPAATFAEKVKKSVARLPGVGIGVDVLVGFPGEDEAAFRNTYDLLASLPVAYLHVFPYSKRPGTVAAGMADQVAKKVKEERVALLRDLDHKKRMAFYRQHLGSVQQVLVEGRKQGKMLRGFSENYIPVHFAAADNLANTLVSVRLEELTDDGVLGVLV
ncbi:MAG TPA: tRNA (N(6)-L-threonylcarbamoyladenosine(37)-C(2))-methylthiotransferase MtaB [Deltaproteobacteria bacterium]|nr:tRNA (N(6)-L-threonylcarbamoyladenosine(37)-C(2))-methylthiotransferase MtaB [Deltaproteobacteria bacterium]